MRTQGKPQPTDMTCCRPCRNRVAMHAMQVPPGPRMWHAVKAITPRWAGGWWGDGGRVGDGGVCRTGVSQPKQQQQTNRPCSLQASDRHVEPAR